MGHVTSGVGCFFLILKFTIAVTVLNNGTSDEVLNSTVESNSVGKSQYQGFGFFNSADRKDSMGEKGAADSSMTVFSTYPENSSSISTTIPTTTKKSKKNKNKKKKKNNRVDMVIAAPVVESGENITDGLFVDPQENTFNIAIGGASISIDLNAQGEIQVGNSTIKQLNGEEVPDLLKGKIPEFLRLANDSSRRSFFDIETNGNIQKCYYIMALKNWANSQGSEVKTAFYNYVENLKLQKEKIRAEQSAKVQQMSEAAQEAHREIQEIIDDDQISKNEETKKISKIFDALSTEVQDELNKLNT